MELLQPTYLWGLLGLSIPLAIHLWNGRQGKILPWAASRWLPLASSQPVRGIRLENWLLLMLRILLILVFILLLSEIFIHSWGKEKSRHTIHLVQPDPALVENFRFELSQALSKGDRLYWLDEGMNPLNDLEEVKHLSHNTIPLQHALHQWVASEDSLNIYLLNSSNTLDQKYYRSPVEPALHLFAPSTDHPSQIIQLTESLSLGLNEEGLLVKKEVEENHGSHLVWKGKDFPAFIKQQPGADPLYTRAALRAITEVYHLEFPEVDHPEEAMVVFDQQMPPVIDPHKLYFIADTLFYSHQPHVIPFPGTRDSILHREFPEIILETLLEHIGLERKAVALSYPQFESSFLTMKDASSSPQSNSSGVLWGLLVLLLAVERYFSLRKGL